MKPLPGGRARCPQCARVMPTLVPIYLTTAVRFLRDLEELELAEKVAAIKVFRRHRDAAGRICAGGTTRAL